MLIGCGSSGGDATRYEFIIAPFRQERDWEIVGGTPDALFVGRTIGGKLVASAIIPSTEDEWQFDRGVEAIGLYEGRPGNPWSCKLFDWWFRTLWARLEEYE